MDINDFPVKHDMTIKWGDMDAFGHVNNTIYFRYFENVRIQYFEKLGFPMTTEGVAPILAETACRFWKPLTFPDTITIGARIVSMANSSFVMEYAIHSHKIGLAATGKGVIVCFDYKKGIKAAIPDSIRKQISVLQPDLT